jgi:molybdopterin-guanine dinucleotide biosynthesis protein A
MFEIEGFILAGGASRRMGTDKARLELGGQTFAARVAAALRTVAERVCVVSARPESAALGLPVVEDVYRDCGALGGLHAALAACRAPWAAVVSCDLPFVTGALFARLAARRDATTEAVAPVQPDGRVQPLCALYRRTPCLARAEQLIAAGELRPRVLLRQVSTCWLASADLADLPDAALFFLNINTPTDYEQIRDEG